MPDHDSSVFGGSDQAGEQPYVETVRVPCAECRQYERMLTAFRSANADWAERHRKLQADFRELLYAALSTNDRLRLFADHAEFTGSMNDVIDFRELVNRLHNERSDDLDSAEAMASEPDEADVVF